MTSASELHRGTALAGRYVLDVRIGSGGAGAVWRAHDKVLGRWVAVKLLHPELGRDPASAARFRTEATAAARLTHPNAVVVFDIGRDGELDYLVMELVDGPDLSELIGGAPMPPQVVAHIGRAVGQALGTAHGHDLVHRDVKPGNVLVTREGVPKVADFGIARAIGDAMSRLTRTGNVMGTARYVAPEQLRDEAVDGRADVYALGLMLHEALTGRPPWGDGTSTEVAMRRLSGDLPPVSSLRDDVPPGLDAVIARATRLHRDERHPDGAELAAALTPFTTEDAAAMLAGRVRDVLRERPAPPQHDTPPSDGRARGPSGAALGASRPADDARPSSAPHPPGAGSTSAPHPSDGREPPSAVPHGTARHAPPGPHPGQQAGPHPGPHPGPQPGQPGQQPGGRVGPQPDRTSHAGADGHTRVIGARPSGGAGPTGTSDLTRGPAGASPPPPPSSSAGPPRRRWKWILVAAAVAVAATVGVLGITDGSLPTTTRPLSDVTVADVGDHDPLGDGRERPDRLDGAVDGDDDTSWQTETYELAELIPPDKDGVGIWFDLGEPHDVHRIDLDLVTSGATFEIWAGDDVPSQEQRPDEWGTRVAEVTSADADESVRIDGETGRVWLVWFTDLPPAADGGGFRAHVADIRVRAR